MMITHPFCRSSLVALGILVVTASCGQVLGLDEFTDAPGGDATTASGAGGEASTGSGGAGTGGEGLGGGTSLCEPGTTRACYSGMAGTDGVGICAAGTETCNEDGTGYEACAGEVLPAVEDCSMPEDEDCSGLACSEPIWANSYGDASTDWPNSVAVDFQSNIVLAGFFQGAINFGPDAATTLVAAKEDDFFLAKFAPNGDHIWSKRFGDDTNELFPILAVDASGNIYWSGLYKNLINLGGAPLTSTGNADFFVAKFAPDGSHLWSRTFGDNSSAWAKAIHTSPEGHVVVAGYFDVTIDFGSGSHTSAGGKDAFVAKLNGVDGSEVWSKTYGDDATQPPADQEAVGMGIDNSGNIIVAGNFSTSMDVGPGGGYPLLTSDGGTDVFVFKVDQGGNRAWVTQFRGVDDEVVSSVDVDAAGSSAIVGTFAGTTTFEGADFIATTKTTTGSTDDDIFLVKLGPTGSHSWSKQFGDSASQAVQLVIYNGAFDPSGDVVIAGGFGGTIDFGGGALVSTGDGEWFAAKFTSTGTHLWSKRFGDAAAGQFATSLAVDPLDHSIVLVGLNDGTMTFGPASLVSQGNSDVVLAKLAP